MPEHALTRPSAPPSLKGTAWLKRPETERVFAALTTSGVETRAVGGAVRDALLGRPVTEIDLASTALPEQVMALVPVQEQEAAQELAQVLVQGSKQVPELVS